MNRDNQPITSSTHNIYKNLIKDTIKVCKLILLEEQIENINF